VKGGARSGQKSRGRRSDLGDYVSTRAEKSGSFQAEAISNHCQQRVLHGA